MHPTPDDESQVPESMGEEPLRVLVVDDTAQIRLLIRLNLELEGWVVEEARDGEEALARLRTAGKPRPDVITLDAIMQPKDGWATLLEIRADPDLARLPVAMVTASVQKHERDRAVNGGVDAVIAKPFDPENLCAILGELAAQGRARRDGG